MTGEHLGDPPRDPRGATAEVSISAMPAGEVIMAPPFQNRWLCRIQRFLSWADHKLFFVNTCPRRPE